MPLHPTDMRLDVTHLLRRAVDRFATADFVVTPERRLTFADVSEASASLAATFVGAGLGKGSRIGAHFSYGPEWVVAWLAANRIGAIYVPLSTAYKPAELRGALRHADVGLLLAPSHLFGVDRRPFVEEALPSLLAATSPDLQLPESPYLRGIWLDGPAPPWARAMSVLSGAVDGIVRVPDLIVSAIEDEVRPSDLAISIYTSGTTAEPKGVVHTQGAIARKAFSVADSMEYVEGDRVFCGMPLFWVGGIAHQVAPALAVGATLLCVERPDPEPSLDLMEREQATRLSGWPGVTGPILAHPSVADRRFPALDLPVFAPGVLRGGGIGMTETLGGYTTSKGVSVVVPEGERGSCLGRLIDDFEVRVVDPTTQSEQPEGTSGAIHVRGYCLMAGLHKHEREETFTADGWYDTGDKGYLQDGLLYFEGRYKEQIKTSGNNVAPPEVEAVFQAFPEVAAAHVLGIPDEVRGELVTAALVPAAGQVIDVDDVCDRARKELSNYKVPRKVLVLQPADVPRLATGKPDRLAIRALLANL